MAGKTGRPPNKRVVCIIPNVWTSKGKLLRGEAASLPPAEADALIEEGKCNGKS